jgi:hypothetical protein
MTSSSTHIIHTHFEPLRIGYLIVISGLDVCLAVNGRRKRAGGLKNVRSHVDRQLETVRAGPLGPLHLSGLNYV